MRPEGRPQPTQGTGARRREGKAMGCCGHLGALPRLLADSGGPAGLGSQVPPEPRWLRTCSCSSWWDRPKRASPHAPRVALEKQPAAGDAGPTWSPSRVPSVGLRVLVQAGRGLGRPARETGWGEGVRADIVEEKGSRGGGGWRGWGGTTSKFPSPLQCRKHYTQRPTETRFSLRRASGVPRRSSHTHAGVSTGSGMRDGAGPGVLEAMGGGRCSAASHLAALGTGSSFTGSQAAPQLPRSRSAVHPPPATGTRRERGIAPGAGGGQGRAFAPTGRSLRLRARTPT